MPPSLGKENKVIRIVKKKKKHAAHHGGSWKVAYADFVTAMMAFFMVMWLLSMDQKMKDSIEGYFSNPVGFKKGFSSGSNIMANGSTTAAPKLSMRLLVRSAEEKRFTQVAHDLHDRINATEELKIMGAHVEAVKTKGGLRIELIESGNGQTFFRNGSAQMTPVMVVALHLIGQELKSLRTPIIIEGHTDSQQFGSDAAYTNWELSADRANAARRTLEAVGVDANRIIEVRGMADRNLRVPTNPMDQANRRISILLPFTVLPGEEERDGAPAGAPPPDAAAVKSST
ncbi:MAG: flagellar motor protein MotB [Gemmatimonadaceae bacterium]